jgi:hypothetical protein
MSGGLQSRLKQLLPLGRAPERLYIDTTCRRLDQGLVEDLREWLTAMASPRLIIIDVLNRIRPAQKPNEGVYDYDVRSLEGLQGLAAEFSVAIIVVHHTRKAEAEDPFDCLSGSTGLPGTADSTFVLARDSQGVTLYGRGRDIEEVERALSFDKLTGQWLILGEAADVRRSGERGAILKALHEATEAMSPVDVAEVTGFKRENVKKLLRDMAKAGEVTSLGLRKGYVHPCGGTSYPLVSTVTRLPETARWMMSKRATKRLVTVGTEGTRPPVTGRSKGARSANGGRTGKAEEGRGSPSPQPSTAVTQTYKPTQQEQAAMEAYRQRTNRVELG